MFPQKYGNPHAILNCGTDNLIQEKIGSLKTRDGMLKSEIKILYLAFCKFDSVIQLHDTHFKPFLSEAEIQALIAANVAGVIR